MDDSKSETTGAVMLVRDCPRTKSTVRILLENERGDDTFSRADLEDFIATAESFIAATKEILLRAPDDGPGINMCRVGGVS